MNRIWVNVLVIYFGLQGLDAIYSDGYIGCYKMKTNQSQTIDNNNGNACKRKCFPGHRYAATSYTNCSCLMESLPEEKVPDGDCSTDCPSQTEPGEYCGGIGTFTIYDAQKTTTTQTTRSTTTSATTSTAPSLPSTVNITSVNTEKSDDRAPLPITHIVLIVVAAITVVVLVNTVVCVLVARRLRRKRLEISETRMVPQRIINNTNVYHSEADVRNHREIEVDTEYDTTTTCRAKPAPTSDEDDYSRLKLPGRYEDPTYSHMKSNQHGACAILESDYSHIGGNAHTCNEKNYKDLNDYDCVEYDKSTKVQLVSRPSPNTGSYDDDIYDKLKHKC